MKNLKINYDGDLIICTGRSRKENKWRKLNIKWSEFLMKVKQTTYTNETAEEYKLFSKEEQDDIKDVGGFVGGELKDGIRRNVNVISRSLLTLDMDYAPNDFWTVFQMLFDWGACLYSTHKHSKDNPRYRLIMPLSRKVTCDEYEAIGRKVGEILGIDYFDDTTYESARLMYWPSTSKNSEYIFEFQDGQWLDADGILGSYEDWTDTSSWPESFRIKEKRSNYAKKQKNPREKEGLIGAFCRTYSIYDAIEKFLGNVYVPTIDINRYTYKNGSTSGGLVVYDNGNFAFSHHSTDIAGGILCNAFDLVRMHKFSHLDKDRFIDGSISNLKLPSYESMLNFCVEDEKVKLTIGRERIEAAKKDFGIIDDLKMDEKASDENINNSLDKSNVDIKKAQMKNYDHRLGEFNECNKRVSSEKEILSQKQISNEEEISSQKQILDKEETLNERQISTEDDMEWIKALKMTKDGFYKATINNIVLILQNDPCIKDGIFLNEFAHFNMIRKDMPWRKIENKEEGDCWNDADDSGLRHYIEEIYGINSPNKINDALAIVLCKNSYHPIREYFYGLKWDNIKRVESIFIDYLGAEDTAYIREVTKKAMIACVARVFKPGIKFDNMIVLVGKQGIGKSHIINLLGQKWYSDSLCTVQGKEAYEQLQDAWIIEMAELSATKKAETEAVKHFISKREDIYREAYGKRVKKFPRQCVFFGTTNDNYFLRDRTGNRRYWPIDTGRCPIKKNLWKDMNQNEINQIWAEAFNIFNNGEKLFLDNHDMENQALSIQEQHVETSDKEGLIIEYLNKLLPENWYNMDISSRRRFIHGSEFTEGVEGTIKREKVCAMEIWVELFQGDPKQLTYGQSKEINDILRNLKGLTEYSTGEGRLRFGKEYGKQKAFIIDTDT